MSNFSIREESSLNKYRTEIPNIILALGLGVYEFTLYCHLKRTAGDNGACFKSLKTLSQESNIGETQIKESIKILSSPFDLLDKKPLIKLEKRFKENGAPDTNLIIIQDVWELNFKYFLDGSQYDPGVGRNTTQGGSQCAYKEELLEEEQLEQVIVCPKQPNVAQTEIIKKKNMHGDELTISLKEIFSYSIRVKKNWTTEEIQKAWEILLNSNNPISDPYRFVEGIINNNRKNTKFEKSKFVKSQQKKGSTQCLVTAKTDQTSQIQERSTPDSIKQAFLKYGLTPPK